MENQQQGSPLQTLVEQVATLEANISKILKQQGVEAVLSDYICPILSTLANAVDQSLVGLNNVAQTAQTTLITSEKTVASEVLSSVCDINNELTTAFAELVNSMAARLQEEDKQKLREIQDLLIELQEIVEPWNTGDDEDDEDDDEEDDDDDDEEDDEDGEEDGDDEEDEDGEEDEAIEIPYEDPAKS